VNLLSGLDLTLTLSYRVGFAFYLIKLKCFFFFRFSEIPFFDEEDQRRAKKNEEVLQVSRQKNIFTTNDYQFGVVFTMFHSMTIFVPIPRLF